MEEQSFGLCGFKWAVSYISDTYYNSFCWKTRKSSKFDSRSYYNYDPNGLFWHIVAGAVVGAVANTVINVGTSLLKGEKITADLVASSLVGGAVTGGVTAATGNVTLGSVAGGAAETITKGAIDGDSIQNIVQDVAVGAVADVAFSKAGKFLKNTSKVKQVTDFAKGTKLGNKIFTHTADYKSEIKRLRGIWKKTGKAVKPKFKTYVDGFVGTTGMELIDKVADMNGSLTPGMDLKKELKNILNSLYDKGEEWVEENRKMQQYTQQALTQILKNLTNEEVATVMCIEQQEEQIWLFYERLLWHLLQLECQI